MASFNAVVRAFRPRVARAAIKPAKAAFGSNPGALRMLSYAPRRLASGRPLVVVLHGCGQHAEAFARDSGWRALADMMKFALLMPEQQASNNPGLCFNWYRPEDTRRGGGEAMSIRQMLKDSMLRYRSDPKRVFVVGFSAGAAMAGALLAAYPAVFAGGAVVAGLPVGCARTPVGAAMRMRRADVWASREMLASDVRAVTKAVSRKSWPRVSVWAGDDDRTVDPANAEMIAAQWGALHGLDALPSEEIAHPRARRRVWARAGKAPAVELWTIAGLGHGFPVSAQSPSVGRGGPWVSECGVSAVREIAAFWGLRG